LCALALLLASCGDSVTTQVLQVQTPLPAREEARYQVVDRNGAQIGRAVFTIEPDGGLTRLTQDYHFEEQQVDRIAAHVDPATMRAHDSLRDIQDGAKQYHTIATYEASKVVVTFNGDGPERTRQAEITEATYDNLESLFLWRTLAMGAGERYSFVNVVIDPRRGTISRALAGLSLSGREQVKMPDGSVREAWRVDFSSAGVTNQAWYTVTADRTLLKYRIARGPTLLLEGVSRESLPIALSGLLS